MGQATPFKPMALVVEEDENDRAMVAMLLEECEMGVIQCDNAEIAMEVLARVGPMLTMLYTDVSLAGEVDGVALAQAAWKSYPDLRVIVTGREMRAELPKHALFMPKPLLPLNVLREAERCLH